MDLRDFSPEMLEQAKQAASAEELLALIKANGIILTNQQAGAAFAALHESGELADDELTSVAGGRVHPTGKTNEDKSKGC